MTPLTDRGPLVLVMVGLPARGKTYLARKLSRYLSWLGIRARVFNVGNYRREHLGSQQPASFFDPTNPDGVAARREMALAALTDLFGWLETGGEVAIYDATNVTRERRDLVRRACQARGLQPIFIESVCTDPDIIASNIHQTKLRMPDYEGVDPENAVSDFQQRIANYEAAYEPVDEPDVTWVKLIDVGDRVIMNRIRGYLTSRLVFFMTNLHLVPRTVILTRHGQSTYNLEDRIGGDPGLTPAGQRFATRLTNWLEQQFPAEGRQPQVWTSTLQRTRQTASGLVWPKKELRNLDEIDAGSCDGMTYDQIAETLPDEFATRRRDKLMYRYPRGEADQDVIDRLDPVIIELERQRDPIVIVAHQAVIRCLYAYLTDQPRERVPHVDVPLHTVIKLTPAAYGAQEVRYTLDL